MAKTLVDMTAEERANCVGMWCDNLVSTADNPKPVVLACVQGEQCWILHTDLHGEWSRFPLGSVSPRPDLPRAWTPDGEPELAQALAEETWEYGVEYKYLTNRGAEWRLDPGVGWHKTYRDAERAASASVQFRIVRRRVSKPEVINE